MKRLKKTCLLMGLAGTMLLSAGCSQGKIIEKENGEKISQAELVGELLDLGKDKLKEKLDPDSEKSKDKAEEKNADKTEENNSEISQSSVPLVMVSRTYDNLYYDDINLYAAYYNVDGIVVLSEGYDKLQTALQKEAKQNLEEARTYLKDMDEMCREILGNGGEIMYGPFEYEGKVIPELINEKIFSYVRDSYYYAGGPHPNTWMQGFTYDVATGERISLRDITADYEGLKKAVIAELESTEQADWMDSTWRETVANMIDGTDEWSDANDYWYLDDYGFHLTFNTYILGSYAMGPVSVKLDFDKYGKLFKEDYIPEKQKDIYHHGFYSDYENGEYFHIDLDGDGNDEVITYKAEGNYDPAYGSAESFNFTITTAPLQNPADETLFQKEIHGFEVTDFYIMKNRQDEYYLYVEMQEENDYHNIYIFSLDAQSGADYVGLCEDGAFQGIPQTDTENLYIGKRIWVLGTYTGFRHGYIDDDGYIVAKDEPYYVLDYNYDYVFMPEMGHPLSNLFDYGFMTAKTDIPVTILDDDKNLNKGSEDTLTAGAMVAPYMTDTKTYMVFKLQDGTLVRVDFDLDANGEWTHTIDGIDEYEVFDPIIYAG